MDASVDKDQWIKFVQKALTPYTTDVGSKGAKPGTYTVKVKFVVNKDGSLSDFVALNDRGYGMAKKVVEIMKNSPKWNPAQQNHKAVASYHTQPFTFVVQDK